MNLVATSFSVSPIVDQVQTIVFQALPYVLAVIAVFLGAQIAIGWAHALLGAGGFESEYPAFDADALAELKEYVGGMQHEDGLDWGVPQDVLDDPLWEDSGRDQGRYFFLKYGDDEMLDGWDAGEETEDGWSA